MQVHIEDPIEGALGTEAHRLDRRRDPGVRDDDVDSAERHDRLLDRHVELSAIAHVAAEAQCTRSELPRLRPCARRINVDDDNPCAAGMESLRGVQADAACATRDEHDLAVDLHDRPSWPTTTSPLNRRPAILR